jgi:hypothetical protein
LNASTINNPGENMDNGSEDQEIEGICEYDSDTEIVTMG